MRKFIVSSLAVVAIAAGGFAAHSAFNISVAQAQTVIIEPGGDTAKQNKKSCKCNSYGVKWDACESEENRNCLYDKDCNP